MRDLYQECPCGSGKKTKFCCYEKRKNYTDLSPIELVKHSLDFRIHEIYINSDWQTTGAAQILVVRQLFNLRYLASLYWVDIFCLGLKKTLCQISINANDVLQLKNEITSEPVEISYEDVRSIIFGAIDYAQPLGIALESETASHWERSKYMIDFQRAYENKFSFGRDGHPLYIQSTDDNTLEIIKILSPLVNQGKATIQLLVETDTQTNDAPDDQHRSDEDEWSEFEDEDQDLENDENEEANTEETFDDRCDYITEDLEEGYYEDALEGSEALLDDYPQESMSYFYMATTLAMMGDSETSITYFKQAIEIEPAGEFYHNLGRAYLDMGQFPEALASWEKTIELEGKDSQIGIESANEIEKLRAQAQNFL